MNTIWKYELELVDVQIIEMPAGAHLLHVARQESAARDFGIVLSQHTPTLWAMVDDEAPKVRRLIGIVGTGNPAPIWASAVYVGTAQCPPFVWHVFDGGEAT
jgi:hypothetical protein